MATEGWETAPWPARLMGPPVRNLMLSVNIGIVAALIDKKERENKNRPAIADRAAGFISPAYRPLRGGKSY
jgi:hypothetical protein